MMAVFTISAVAFVCMLTMMRSGNTAPSVESRFDREMRRRRNDLLLAAAIAKLRHVQR